MVNRLFSLGVYYRTDERRRLPGNGDLFVFYENRTNRGVSNDRRLKKKKIKNAAVLYLLSDIRTYERQYDETRVTTSVGRVFSVKPLLKTTAIQYNITRKNVNSDFFLFFYFHAEHFHENRILMDSGSTRLIQLPLLYCVSRKSGANRH